MKIWQGRKRRNGVHIVENGRVMCPVQHRDIDVERCLTCSFLEYGVDGERGDLEGIACRRPRTLAGVRLS